MSEYFEKRKIVQAVPVGRPVVETQHDAIVHERRGISGAEVTALVLAAIACAVVITMLIMNNQQANRDQQLAEERAAAQQIPAQTPEQTPMQPQQPPVVVMPQSPASTVPVPVPVPSQSAPAATAPSSTQLELDITSGLLDDPELRSVPIDVRVMAGVATLSGQVPSDELKTRAERIARRVKGVGSVINNMTVVVQP